MRLNSPRFKFKTEAELAQEIVTFLRESGWDVYQEVSARGCIADIVAVWNGKIVWVIETKLTLNLTVLGQAWGWRRYAHYVSVGIPAEAAKAKTAAVARRFMEDNGVGCLCVGAPNSLISPVKTWLDCRLLRKANASVLLTQLCPELRDYKQAGSTEGHRYTPFRATCDKLTAEVKKHPEGIAMKAALLEIKHHYSSHATAQRCLVDLCKQGYFKNDFNLDYDGRTAMLRPVEVNHG